MSETVKQSRVGTNPTSSAANLRITPNFVLYYNGNIVTEVFYDGQPVTKLTLNGTEVWKKAVM